MKGDIGMANYEKQVEQEAAYPIPISLYNCYRTVRHSYASLLMPHCPVTVVQIYRNGVHLFFIICHPYIPLHLEEMIFYTSIFDCAECTMVQKRDVDTSLMQHVGIELGPHRYDATLQTSTLCYTHIFVQLLQDSEA